MKKRDYDSPTLEVISLGYTPRLLESLSIHGTMEDYGDGGDLGDTQDGDGTSFIEF